ncbi:ATP-binding protein [Tessaracoccus lubricantis]|uniref:ATP-binding protein n=1 Tax=Tessaracoccus lubricantis TaxID=545543 RepID=UPI00362D02AA
MLTSNLPFSGWGGVFRDQVVAAAMIDRIVHHADVQRHTVSYLHGLLAVPFLRHEQRCR